MTFEMLGSDWSFASVVVDRIIIITVFDSVRCLSVSRGIAKSSQAIFMKPCRPMVYTAIARSHYIVGLILLKMAEYTMHF